MNRNLITPLFLGLISLLAGCVTPESTNPGSSTLAYVEVRASHREHMVLPADAELTATLEDVSMADAAALRLGETRIKTDSAPPYHVRIAYDPDVIDARHIYAVRVQIRYQGRLLMTSDTHTPVLTQGKGLNAELLLISVPSS